MKWLLLLALWASPLRADEPVKFSPEGFGGLDTFHDSAAIADQDAQDAENVLTDAGYLEKRPGNRRVAQLIAGYSGRFIGEFIDSSANRYAIFHASGTVYQTNFGASPVALSTTNVDYEISMTVAYGKAVIGNGTDTTWTWDGISTGAASGAPKCKFLLFDDERLYCANTDASTYRVSVSSFGGITYWTIPATLSADSPTSFDFQRQDGEPITCFFKTPCGKFIGKAHSTHILKGYDNNTYYKRIIDPKIGCQDQRSIQMLDGFLIWLAVDGVYSWNGSGPPVLISKDIFPTVTSIRQAQSNAGSWVTTSQNDWQTGNLSASGPGALVSATIETGAITPSSWTVTETSTADWNSGSTTTVRIVTYNEMTGGQIFNNVSFEDESGHLTNWTVGSSWNNSASAMTNCAIYGSWGAYAATTGGTIPSVTVDVLRASDNVVLDTRLSSGVASAIDYHSFDVSAQSVNLKIRATDNNTSDTLVGPSFDPATLPDGYVHYAYFGRSIACGSGPCYQGCTDFPHPWAVKTSTFTSAKYDTALTTPTWGWFNATISSTTNSSVDFQTRVSAGCSTTFDAGVAVANSDRITSNQKGCIYYTANFQNKIASQTATYYDGTLVARTTAYYTSQVKFIDTRISTWTTMDATEQTVGGSTVSYWVRAASYSFAGADATPTWVAQTNHQNIVASTGSYVQLRTWWSLPSGTSTAIVPDLTINWREGTAKPVASLVYDHRYMLCVMIATDTDKNDKCLVLQKNNRWTKFSGPSYSALGLYNNEPYALDGSTNSYVWKIMQSGVYRDDVSAINAYWLSRDWMADRPFNGKVLEEIWVDAAYDASSSIDVGYSVNKSTTVTSNSLSLSSTADYINKTSILASGFSLGKYFRFKISNSTIDQYFRVNRYAAYGDVKARTQD